MTSFLLPEHKSHAFLIVIDEHVIWLFALKFLRPGTSVSRPYAFVKGDVIHPQLWCIGSGHEAILPSNDLGYIEWSVVCQTWKFGVEHQEMYNLNYI